MRRDQPWGEMRRDERLVMAATLPSLELQTQQREDCQCGRDESERQEPCPPGPTSL